MAPKRKASAAASPAARASAGMDTSVFDFDDEPSAVVPIRTYGKKPASASGTGSAAGSASASASASASQPASQRFGQSQDVRVVYAAKQKQDPFAPPKKKVGTASGSAHAGSTPVAKAAETPRSAGKRTPAAPVASPPPPPRPASPAPSAAKSSAGSKSKPVAKAPAKTAKLSAAAAAAAPVTGRKRRVVEEEEPEPQPESAFESDAASDAGGSEASSESEEEPKKKGRGGRAASGAGSKRKAGAASSKSTASHHQQPKQKAGGKSGPAAPALDPAVVQGLQDLGPRIVASLPSREPLEMYSQRTLKRHDKTRTMFTVNNVGAGHPLLSVLAACAQARDAKDPEGEKRRGRIEQRSALMTHLQDKGWLERVSSQFLSVAGLRTERCLVDGDISLVYDPAKHTLRVTVPISFRADE